MTNLIVPLTLASRKITPLTARWTNVDTLFSTNIIQTSEFESYQKLENEIISFIETNPKCLTSDIIDNFPDNYIQDILEILNKLESNPDYSVKPFRKSTNSL